MTEAMHGAPSAQLPADTFKTIFRADPEAGQLIWIAGAKAGLPAGFLSERGYVLVHIQGHNYRVSRLIWLLVHGRWPKWRLGYVNGDRLDNRLANLRELDLPQKISRPPPVDTIRRPSISIPYTPAQAIAVAKDRIERHAFAEPNSGCHIWMARVDRRGYGRLVAPGFKTEMAHRIAYEFACGEIPEGMVLDHLCRTRCCVNPDHLEVTTNTINAARGRSPAALNANKTHCKHGHELSGENVYLHRSGTRACRACGRARTAKAKARRKANSAPFATRSASA